MLSIPCTNICGKGFPIPPHVLVALLERKKINVEIVLGRTSLPGVSGQVSRDSEAVLRYTLENI